MDSIVYFETALQFLTLGFAACCIFLMLISQLGLAIIEALEAGK